MKKEKFNEYYCQHCGSDERLEGKIFDDRIIVDEDGNAQYVGLSDDFEATGQNTCAECGKDWTGKEPIDYI